MIRKLILWAVGIGVLLWALSNPDQAGTDVHGLITAILGFFHHAANGSGG